MFYSQFILAKKGPLGTIWIAAHLERKLRKNQVADTDIGVSVDSILFPEMPIALRLSSHLLLGVVRIYSKKVNYLFDDCSEALLKVKQAFRSTAVDLPPEESTAPYHSITMPETFDLDDFELPENDLQGSYVDQHISSKEHITLQDTMEGVVYSTSKFGVDERFGDGDASGLDLNEELMVEKAASPDLATGTLNSDFSDDPQASVHVSASDILNQEIDEYDGDNEPVDYAQAPCTPGLWEEPNLSKIQETSACDDHQEPENHSIPEFAVKENLENASHQHHHNQFESHEKSPPHIAATEQKLINDLGSTPTESCLAETVIPVSKNPPEVGNLLNKNVSDMAPGFQIFHENHANFVEYQGNQKPGFQSANNNHENFVEYQGNQENAFHLTTELESHTEKDNLVSTLQNHASLAPKDSTIPVLFPPASMSNSDFPVLRPCVTSVNHDNSEGPDATEPLNKNFPEIRHAEFGQNHEMLVDNVIQKEAQVENFNSYTNFPVAVIQREVQVENSNSYTNNLSAPEKRLSFQTEPQVENFNSYTNFPAPVIQREVQVENSNSYTKDFSAPEKRLSFQREAQVEHFNSYANFPAPVIQKEVQVENSNSYTNDFSAPEKRLSFQREAQVENFNSYTNFPAPVIQREFQVENSNSYTNDFSAPEKRLSLPHWLSDVPKSFVPENTPVEKDVTSGKKRTFTESSMTDHSLSLNKSSGFYTTNVTRSSSLNQSSGLFTTNATVQSLNLNESSGFYTTNTTAQSLNLNQSSGPFTINMTGQSVMNDEDLLSSILVGRKSSILDFKPTPPVVTPSTKRRRSAPKTTAMKRKVLVDDNMVLHGDTIRQQLTNTEDIRRLRKKAPCTRSEISMLEKQFWEDKVFSEPIFTGVSIKLASLHNQLYNLSTIIVSHKDASLEGGKDPESISQMVEKGTQKILNVPDVPKENANFDLVAQPNEFMMRDNHTHDSNTVNLDYYGSQPTHMVATEHVAEPFKSKHDLFGETNAMEINSRSFPDADIGVSIMPTEVEPPQHAVVVPSDPFNASAAMGEVQMDASLQTDAPGVSSSGKIDVQSFDLDVNGNKEKPMSLMDASLQTDVPDVNGNISIEEPMSQMNASLQTDAPDVNGNKSIEKPISQMDASLQTDAPDVNGNKSIEKPISQMDASLQTDAPDVNGNKSFGLDVASGIKIDDVAIRDISEEKQDQGIEFRKNQEVIKEHATLASEVESNAHNSAYNQIYGENFGAVETDNTEVNPVIENAPLDERENPAHQVTFETTEINMKDIPSSNRVGDDESTHPAVENNTDFLNFDDADDDVADADGDYAPDVEATRVIDNSGWSSRTKAVAKYLQIMFDKEGERGRNMIAVNNLLVGKTRKEASRMFFETLVLKTKDYIHVEQADPFGNINVFPRAKLLKSDF